MHIERMLLFLMVCSGALAWAANAQPGGLRIAAGEPFPRLVLPSLKDGRPMSLADFRGKKVILHVFASW